MADFKGTIVTAPEELRGSLSSDLSLSGRLSSLGIPGNGIASIEKTSTDGLTDTYTITYDDGATTTYQITNGNGIVSAVFNNDNTLTLSFGDGTVLTTGVLRGDDGEKVLLKAENNVVSYKYESDPNWTTLVDLTGFADDASNAADRATAKAEEARQSATRAENSASNANDSAGIATTKAEEAASSEEQAGISMRRAETAASDALASKNLAQEAAATATTAQDNARIYSERTLGYANNAAQSAQSASNSAASAAQSATGLSEAVASAQQSAREAASSATQAQEYYDGIDEVAVQAMEDYLIAHPAVQSVNGKTRHVVLNAEDVGALPDDTFIPSKITDLTNDSDFATNGDLAALQTKLNALADSDDTTLDQLSEIVAYIKNNKNLIDGITTGKVSVSDIVDNLTSTATNKPLSAKQGKVLKDLIDAIVIPTNVSAFTNDAGYLTEHQDISGKQDVISDLATIRSGAALGATALQVETDPTVPAWAKAATKPSYTATEVGALPSDTYIPIKVSDLANDVGYLTQHQDISGKANTADLATVATSGNYNDLSNKPTIPTKVSDLTDDSGHYTKPSGGIPASDLADGVVPVEDVQVNGTSILSNGVANVPIATASKPGTVLVSGYGLQMQSNGNISTKTATSTEIKAGSRSWEHISPNNQHESTFYGLAKAAGDTTQSSSNNTVGNYTDSAKTAIKNMLGVPEDPLVVGTALPASADLNSYTTPGNYTADSTVIASITHAPTTTVEYKLTVEQISDEVIKQTVTTIEAPANVYQRTGDSSSTDWVFGDWVKEIKSTDYASSQSPGITLMSSTFGLYVDNNYPEYARVYTALDSNIKTADNTNDCRHRPITPYNQHKSVFYGLAKVAGQDMSTSNNPVGTYTDEAKSAIKNMIGVEDLDVQINGTSIVENGVANIPRATGTVKGVISATNSNGVAVNSTGELYVARATDSQIKLGSTGYRPIVPQIQDMSTFYGLAKAAGDTTQSASDNLVGDYTSEAKEAIQEMLDVPSTADKADMITTTATGSLVTITDGADNMPVKSLKVSFGPIQEGDGDPSPENVRAISGRNNLSVTRAGKNLYDAETYPLTSGWVHGGEGGIGSDRTYYCIQDYIPCVGLRGKTITLNHRPGGSNPGFAFYNNEKVFISGEKNNSRTADEPMTATVPNNACYYRFTVSANYLDEIQIELGSEATEYEPYRGVTASVNWATEAGTVYGGMIDLVSGKLTATHSLITISELSWIYNSDYARFGATIPKMIATKYPTRQVPLVCSTFKVIDDGRPYGEVPNNAIYGAGTPSSVYVHASGYTNVEDFVSAYGSQTILYELTEPVEYQLSAQQIRTLLGTNNFWSDGDNIELEYSADTKSYVDKNTIDDVQVDGTSVTNNGIANIPIATNTTPGVVIADPNYGIYMANVDNRRLCIYFGSSSAIKTGTNTSASIPVARQHESAFYGLAKAAGADMKNSSNAVGTYTDEAKTAIKNMIGVPTDTYDLNLGEAIPASADLNTYTTSGVYYADDTVISTLINEPTVYSEYKLIVEEISNDTITQTAKFYNGDIYIRTANSSSGSWRFNAWNKLIDRDDYATASVAGVVKVDSTNGIGIESGHKLYIEYAPSNLIKSGTGNYRPITPPRQHEAVFYGLARAAGDTTQAISSNAIGTYTQEAKAAIKSMLDITTPEAVGSCVEYISDSSVTIVGEPNTRYVCGEVTSIDITPPTVGTIDVTFTSGSTIAILTLPSTVKMPEWWGGIETGYTYELVITDGVYAGVMAWPQ